MSREHTHSSLAITTPSSQPIPVPSSSPSKIPPNSLSKLNSSLFSSTSLASLDAISSYALVIPVIRHTLATQAISTRPSIAKEPTATSWLN